MNNDTTALVEKITGQNAARFWLQLCQEQTLQFMLLLYLYGGIRKKNVMKYEIHASPQQTAETEILKKDSHFDIREI